MKVVEQLEQLVMQTRQAVVNRQPLPYEKPTFQFSSTHFRFMPSASQNIKFSMVTLGHVTRQHIFPQHRLTALVLLLRQILKNSTKVTKRSIYYQLIRYYQGAYETVDEDIAVIRFTLKIKREHLGILASARGIVCADMVYSHEGQTRSIDKDSIFHLHSNMDLLELKSKKIVVVQKQSVFNYLLPFVRKSSEMMLVTSKGYPDFNTQQFLLQAVKHTEEIYYLGDLDPFGFDILLTYVFGDPLEQFGTPTISWLDVEALVQFDMVDGEQLAKSFRQLNVADRKKLLSILNRPYFDHNILSGLLQTSTQIEALQRKMCGWRQKIQKYGQLSMKMELESLLRCLRVDPLFALEIMIGRQIFN